MMAVSTYQSGGGRQGGEEGEKKEGGMHLIPLTDKMQRNPFFCQKS